MSVMRRSVSFDRAADYYDRTRAMSPEARRATAAALLEELAGRGRCLEVGVGTGAIALALAEAGVPIVGVDISRRMMERLVEKAGGQRPFPLAMADATALPFRSSAFGAAVARHVLHLVPRWERAVEELLRVVRPGGVLLMTHGWFASTELDEVMDRFLAETGLERPFAGLDPHEVERLDGKLAAAGARARSMDPFVERTERPLEEFLSGMERGLYSWTWQIEEEARRRAAKAVRAWAEERFGPLDRPILREIPHRWRVYDVP